VVFPAKVLEKRGGALPPMAGKCGWMEAYSSEKRVVRSEQ